MSVLYLALFFPFIEQDLSIGRLTLDIKFGAFAEIDATEGTPWAVGSISARSMNDHTVMCDHISGIYDRLCFQRGVLFIIINDALREPQRITHIVWTHGHSLRSLDITQTSVVFVCTVDSNPEGHGYGRITHKIIAILMGGCGRRFLYLRQCGRAGGI